MGYIDIQSREDIDGLIEKTLSSYYHTGVKVCDKYSSGSFILNPRLNSAIFYKASKQVKKAVRRGHTARRNALYWLMMQVYLRIAFSKAGLFGCKYITFEKLPDNAKNLYIMPGNMKIKLFDYGKKTVTNVMKEDFSYSSLEKEISVRQNPKWKFVPEIITYDTNKYTEQLLDGCTFDRLKNRKKPFALQKIKSDLYEIQQSDRKDVALNSYVQELLTKTQELLRQIEAEEKTKDRIYDFAQKIAQSCDDGVITLSASHGDFQNGNIFVCNNADVYLLDWETYDVRSLGYDILTFFYSFRYRRDFLARIDSFLNDGGWNGVSKAYYGKIVDKKVVLSIYLLEDILWLLQESVNTEEKRISDNLLKYADICFEKEVLRRL